MRPHTCSCAITGLSYVAKRHIATQIARMGCGSSSEDTSRRARLRPRRLQHAATQRDDDEDVRLDDVLAQTQGPKGGRRTRPRTRLTIASTKNSFVVVPPSDRGRSSAPATPLAPQSPQRAGNPLETPTRSQGFGSGVTTPIAHGGNATPTGPHADETLASSQTTEETRGVSMASMASADHIFAGGPRNARRHLTSTPRIVVDNGASRELAERQ